VTSVWSRIRSEFPGWGFGQKEACCRYLVQPIIYQSAARDEQRQESRRTDRELTGGLVLNKNGFDTLGLFQVGSGYTRSAPYHPPCGTPGSSAAPGASDFDPGHEDHTRCSNTVQVGGDCWLMGTVNYGTFGLMMKLCHDWLDPGLLGYLPGLAALRQAFSRQAVVSLVGGYKIFDRDDPGPPLRWALATYDGGPSAHASAPNRASCAPTCSVPYTSSSFDYAWEPYKPHYFWSAGAGAAAPAGGRSK